MSGQWSAVLPGWGIEDRFSPHSFRATDITRYIANGGSLAEAQKLTNKPAPYTTKLYDHNGEEVSRNEIERIKF